MLQKYLPFFFFSIFFLNICLERAPLDWGSGVTRFCSTVQINSPARDLISSPGNSMEWQGRELVLLWGQSLAPLCTK